MIHEDISKGLLPLFLVHVLYKESGDRGRQNIFFLEFHIHASLYSYCCAQSIYSTYIPHDWV